MNQKLIVESVLKYLNREDFDSSIVEDSLVDPEFYAVLSNTSFKNDHHIIYTIFAYLGFKLYHDPSFSISSIFPTLNKFFKEFSLEPIKLKYTISENIYESNQEGYDSVRISQGIKLIKLMINSIDFNCVNISKELIDNSLINMRKDPSEYQKVIESLDSRSFEKLLFLILLEMIESIKENKRAFFDLVGLFLISSSLFYGNHVFSVVATLRFFDIVNKYADLKKLPVKEILNSVKKLYISSFLHYMNLLTEKNKYLDIEELLYKEMIGMKNSKFSDLNEQAFQSLQAHFHIDANLWFSPFFIKENSNSRNEKKDGKSIVAHIEDFLKNDEAGISVILDETRSSKLLLISVIIYDLARKSFHKDKSWIRNSKIEELISVVEQFISETIKLDISGILDQRLLSLISAKNAVKIKYNIYNNKWTPREIVNKHLEEIEYIIDRKFYLLGPATCGKVIEEIAKIQDYLNLNNIYISLEKQFNEEMKNMQVMSAINSLNLCNGFKIEKEEIDRIASFRKKGDYYFIRQTRFTLYYELANHYLSAIKFLGPSLVCRKVSDNISLSLEFLHKYWNYFRDRYLEEDYEIKISKNSDMGEYI